ncbi:16S rRNA (guanine(966)-N(2))-methyltransferase RsmD [Marinitenerispora sediminis]|uniref:16S rRNA (Guanine(966)-N(2))-methyltransferase RsmD n=1 Tax=Marinitenerispora sediminis TaxID=1931232 RepID=A0A368TBE7_9ACTN|nr:16S rRNA (guanine(966)-N(2))-methyltransferase RsmD [Marinitenerispora sediminis]RCV54042.1 16S rRNA (guanine(966)-N(2))-methyltransferase RsmD [Marinitenerispora sediminis]RCV60808.1 16S rRNA (guanine(966)-N(2))-methyltransferase RsmD [Marinitenerispora sediminis]RCV62438.1 16S rRNA (guanine(966)-N(2))-methyltransferase RsmD [Marinitenerispora sediminis]
MTRIIAGTAGGRRLAVPEGRTTRPTSDRAREALFASVLSELGSLDGLRALDLYAGSGAIGLEALSRGAAHALLVESDRRAAAVIRRNIAALGLAGAELAADRVRRVLERGPAGGYHLVVADPPYATPAAEIAEALGLLRDRGWLAADALVVVERAGRDPDLVWPEGYEPGRVRRYGEAALWYGRAASLRDRA